MIKRFFFILSIFCTITGAWSQEKPSTPYSAGIEAFGYLSNEKLPFWMFTNTYGRLGEDSNGLIYAFAKAEYQLSQNASFTLKGSGSLRDGIDPGFQRAELYANFRNNWIDVTLGSKNFSDDTYQLSSVRRNILFSSNTRALPGVLIQNAKPIKVFKNLSFDAAIAHYELNDNRFVQNTKVHYKNLYVNWDITKNNNLRVGLQHVAQWGGTSTTQGDQPDGLSDFTQIFFGRNGGNDAAFGDQINALGNHIGSYSIAYTKRNASSFDIDIYYQSIFEDRSGRELNNFPDGVWGIAITPKKNTFFKQVLYEYVQTVSQSGRPQLTQTGDLQSGGDNYFTNSIYRSGWTYEGRTIGLPFINVVANSEGIDPNTNNRSIAHHLGLLGSVWKLDYIVKVTYVENLGTYAVARTPRDSFLYSYFKTTLPLEKIGSFSAEIGADFNDNRDTFFAIGLGYKYQF